MKIDEIVFLAREYFDSLLRDGVDYDESIELMIVYVVALAKL